MDDFQRELTGSINFIYKVIMGFVSDTETAKDLTQQVLLRILRKKLKFNEKSSFKTWVYRIAVNTAINHFNRPKLSNERVQWYADKWEDEDTKNDVRTALLRLAEEKRDVLVLYYFLGYHLNEIAENLGQPMGTVSARFERAKKEFKDILLKMGYEYE